MDQYSFDFNQEESHPRFLQLSKPDQQELIQLMSQLIATTYLVQENNRHEHTEPTSKNYD
jgi:hypothetical protein